MILPDKKELDRRRSWIFGASFESEKIYLANWLEDRHREIVKLGYEKWKTTKS